MNDLTLTLNGICLAFDFRALVLIGPTRRKPGAGNRNGRSRPGVRSNLELAVSLFDRPFIFTPRSIITSAIKRSSGPRLLDWLPDGGYQMPRSEVFGLDVHGREAQVLRPRHRYRKCHRSPCWTMRTWVLGLVEIDPASAESTATDRIDRSGPLGFASVEVLSRRAGGESSKVL